ncbi:hypothetical protein TWF132_006592 [Orbilia oligospora]|nr:hypothetical protein TWF132_006592 [Orbilia oligospora]
MAVPTGSDIAMLVAVSYLLRFILCACVVRFAVTFHSICLHWPEESDAEVRHRLSPVSKLLAELFKKQRVAAPRRLRDPAKTKKKLAGP